MNDFGLFCRSFVRLFVRASFETRDHALTEEDEPFVW